MGKTMSRYILFFSLLFIFLIPLNAQGKYKHVTKEKKGQSYYLKRCSACHGEGNRGGNIYSIKEWKQIFSKKGKELYELHEGEMGTEDTLKYILSKDFKKEAHKMLRFIQEFAYDSEYIPTCY